MWAFLLFTFCLSDSAKGISYSVRLVEGSQTFGVQVRVEGADRFGWLVLYRRLPGAQAWAEVQKVYVDRWILPKMYTLQDPLRGELGWAYRVGWRVGSQEEELGVYYPYGRLPEPPNIRQEETGRPIIRCVFPEGGHFLVRGYNSYGEEVFTFSVEVPGATIERYQLPPLRKGRYLVRLLMPESGVSLAETIVAL